MLSLHCTDIVFNLLKFLLFTILLSVSSQAALVMRITHYDDFGFTLVGFSGSATISGTKEPNAIVLTTSFGGTVTQGGDLVDLDGNKLTIDIVESENTPTVTVNDVSKGRIRVATGKLLEIEDNPEGDRFILNLLEGGEIDVGDIVTFDGFMGIPYHLHDVSWNDFNQGTYELNMTNSGGLILPVTLIVESVPEPTTISLLGLGAAAIFARRKR